MLFGFMWSVLVYISQWGQGGCLGSLAAGEGMAARGSLLRVTASVLSCASRGTS